MASKSYIFTKIEEKPRCNGVGCFIANPLPGAGKSLTGLLVNIHGTWLWIASRVCSSKGKLVYYYTRHYLRNWWTSVYVSAILPRATLACTKGGKASPTVGKLLVGSEIKDNLRNGGSIEKSLPLTHQHHLTEWTPFRFQITDNPYAREIFVSLSISFLITPSRTQHPVPCAPLLKQ